MAKIKEENYFDMFVTSVEYSCKVSDKLLDMVKNYTNIKQKADSIHETEHEADQHFHKIFEQLMKSFITPIEREDILLLAQSIDDLTDAMDSLAYSFYILNVEKLRGDVIDFVELLVKCCHDLKLATIEFKKFKKSKLLTDNLMAVNNMEEEGDRFYQHAVRVLFTQETNPLEIIKWREIYRKLELCIDSCEDIANNINGIVLKNS